MKPHSNVTNPELIDGVEKSRHCWLENLSSDVSHDLFAIRNFKIVSTPSASYTLKFCKRHTI
jgi:hypothetical protein